MYSFKTNPKQLVVNLAKKLYGKDAKVVVGGTRPDALVCKQLDVFFGTYYVECFVDGELKATAHTRDWRKAYKLLAVNVEKAHEIAKNIV